jgi:hypothetical protein
LAPYKIELDDGRRNIFAQGDVDQIIRREHNLDKTSRARHALAEACNIIDQSNNSAYHIGCFALDYDKEVIRSAWW